jgi:hypothetical protein
LLATQVTYPAKRWQCPTSTIKVGKNSPIHKKQNQKQNIYIYPHEYRGNEGQNFLNFDFGIQHSHLQKNEKSTKYMTQ